MTHQVGSGVTGRSRRHALGLALKSKPDRVLYSDLDHVIRCLDANAEEMAAVVCRPDIDDLVVIGRSPEAFARSPARLRQTEAIVNHVYALATGREADLMFAVRLMTAATAALIVAECKEDSIANDVEWPMYAEKCGLSVGYAAADGLDYRATGDFDRVEDVHDRDPDAWVHRVELAAQHLRVLRTLRQQ